MVHLTLLCDNLCQVNQIVDIMLHFSVHKDWLKAFTTAIPSRKSLTIIGGESTGAGAKADEDDESQDGEDALQSETNEKAEKQITADLGLSEAAPEGVA